MAVVPSLLARIFLITTLVLLIVPCVILKILIFIKLQDIIPHFTRPNGHEVIEMEADSNSDNNNDPSSSGSSTSSTQANVDSGEIRVHATEETIAKLEREAMRALMFSVLSLLILYVPRILYDFQLSSALNCPILLKRRNVIF